MNDVHYLGDGLYVAFDGYQLCLMANSPTEPTDTVYIEPQVWSQLVAYVERLKTVREEGTR